MKIQMSRKSAFTLVEIMIVVAIIGLLAAIAIPNFVKARTTAQQNACINNLRQLEGAKDQWAIENKASTGDPIPDATKVYEYLKGEAIPVCPANGTYSLGNVGTNAECSKKSLTEAPHQLPVTP